MQTYEIAPVLTTRIDLTQTPAEEPKNTLGLPNDLFDAYRTGQLTLRKACQVAAAREEATA